MVAFVGAGIDYMRPGLADRLARDGEGEIIGFDLVDRDRRPYCRVDCEAETNAAEAVVAAAPQSRLAVFKVDGVGLAAPAIQMAAQAKAAVIVVHLPDDAQTAGLLKAASERFRDTLIVLAPRPPEAPPEKSAASTSKAQPAPETKADGSQAAKPDTVIMLPAPAAGNGSGTVPEVLDRAARIAARAATIVAASPSTRGAALRAEIEAAAN